MKEEAPEQELGATAATPGQAMGLGGLHVAGLQARKKVGFYSLILQMASCDC